MVPGGEPAHPGQQEEYQHGQHSDPRPHRGAGRPDRSPQAKCQARSVSFSNVRRMMPSTHGMIIDPPNAGNIRAAISIGAFGVNAASAEAKPTIANPVSRTRRLPTRFASVSIGTRNPTIGRGQMSMIRRTSLLEAPSRLR